MYSDNWRVEYFRYSKEGTHFQVFLKLVLIFFNVSVVNKTCINYNMIIVLILINYMYERG